MKINQVEELVGITKKNIRFYEDQGLIKPDRDPENSYRDYSMSDVEKLRRIKLLRQLEVPCETIRKVTDGELSLNQCMADQMDVLTRRQTDLEHAKEICAELRNNAGELTDLDASGYLEEMQRLEKGGAHFMDVKKSDVKKTKTGAIIAAIVFIVFMLGMVLAMAWGQKTDPIPTGLFIFLEAIPIAVIIGTVIALIQRMREIKGGELDEARKY
ncbi:MAG: MerR family transcriptional regulator [Firmicutes bacterium]|nr:MerR family transcriptional regulator [Bacillota bacterium]